MIVNELMTPEPFVVQVTESVGTVLAKLREADVRHLPVVHGRRLVGIVSDRDLQVAMNAIPGPARGGGTNPLEAPISTLMSADVITVHAEDEVTEVIDLMLDHKIGAVPVTDADSQEVIGIVSYLDVLRVARRALA